MQELRYILVALGGIAIAALLIHGLWTNRKNRKVPIKEKPLGRVESRSRGDDSFDDEGVGQVRVVSNRRAEPKIQPEEPKPARRAPPIYRREEEEDDELDDLPPLRHDVEPAEPVSRAPRAEPAYAQPRQGDLPRASDYAAARQEPLPRASDYAAAQREPAPVARQPEPVAPRQIDIPVYGQPRAAEPAPQLREEEEPLEQVPTRKTSAVIRRNPVQPRSRPQREPVMGAPVLEEESVQLAESYAAAYQEEPAAPEPVIARAPVEKIWQDVYVINLMARPGRELDGASLLASLMATSFKFGEMDIFHRHESRDGHGEILFSIINMVKPGTFNPYRMEQFSTPGVSLFMQLPLRNNAALAFEEMLRTADQLASDLDAMLTDSSRSPLGDDSVDRYRRELAAYEASRA